MKNLRFFLIILGIVAISLAMANGLDPQGDATAEKTLKYLFPKAWLTIPLLIK
jgi:hypothetical protein